MVREKKPVIIFLMETKLRKSKMELVRCKLSFSNMIVVDSVGKSGGLALLWNETAGVEVRNFSYRHINAIVRYPLTGLP
jgi:hypothetical protein